MNITIIGVGKMGSELSKKLSEEGHNITVIDKNSEALNSSANTQDVSCVLGDGVDIDILKSAFISNVDLVIATTAEDETNILCCLMSKKLGVKHTIARIRRPELTKSIQKMQEDLGISMTINPELAAATEISRILRLPSAAKVDFFAKGKVEMVECKIAENSIIDGMAINRIQEHFHAKVLICAVQRRDEVIIPNGSFVLNAGDQISITSSPRDIVSFFRVIGIPELKIKNVVIVGGSKIGFCLAQMLIEMNIKVKIIDHNMEKCREFSEALPKAMVIHGNGSDEELLAEEGLDSVDALVALTGLDEENVVISMYAQTRGVLKVITKINHISFSEILEKAGIECVITPHLIASNYVLRYVRAMQNSLGSNVEALSKIVNNNVEALEFRVRESFIGCEVPLRELKFKTGILIACIIRTGSVIFPNGNDVILTGDRVIVITAGHGYDDLNDVLRS